MSDLDRAIAAANRKVAEQHRKVCVAVAARIHNNLVTRSPVDSSAFRSDWTISVGEPLAREFKANPPFPSNDPAAVLNSAPLFPRFTINNAAPYAGELAEGRSPQAPAGWIDAAVEVAIEEVRTFGPDRLAH